MEVLEDKNIKKQEKTFNESQLTLINRLKLLITGVEKVYETNDSKIQLKASGSNLLILGENLNISRLDVDAGNVDIEGKINEIKYLTSENKGGFFKKIFK